MTTRASATPSSDRAHGAARHRAGYARSAAAVGVAALLLAAASVGGLGGREPAGAIDAPAADSRVTSVRDRPETTGREVEDEFRLDPRELHDYGSNVHG
jgi:hypothetical protein